MDNNELLGSTERYIAQQIRATIKACRRDALALAEHFDIDTESDHIEGILLDSSGKETAMSILDTITKLQENLSGSALVAIISEVFFRTP